MNEIFIKESECIEMKNAVVIKEKDFLFDISIVATPYAKERNEWVNKNVDIWHDGHIISDVPEVYLILPAFALVSSVANFNSDTAGTNRCVVAVDFCVSLDDIKEIIQEKMLCESINSTMRVDLFMFNGLHYEKIPYDIGVYEKKTPETTLELPVSSLQEFDFEKTVAKKYFEKYMVIDTSEIDETPIFIEIPNVWEVFYNNMDLDENLFEDRVHFYYYKNLETVIEDAIYEMYETPSLFNVQIENTWYNIDLRIDSEEYEKKKITEFAEDDFEIFKKCAKAKIFLNY